ncbi:sulfurtransferase [Anaerobacillus alkaliphilus]|uniref:Sulfurtransferase n=1 Tax=Anaerobacillus alkaliphilus TaxID=1548597 RepID=A0A4Q0VXT9_9BACI|nr:sulfurtransferase [Anaerobacillus alkaliphilus]RXJ03996.1 sulfurtransferase [Anaerobacillus alkaliphilus]
MLKHLVSAEWLRERMNDGNIRILDCRFELGKPNAGFDAYLADHIPNAVYVDLEKDMSGQKSLHGGRHPLPSLQEFASKVSAVGIDHTVTVVAYDDQGGAMASRLAWLLSYLGHKNVFVLNTSYSSWKDSGFPVTDEIQEFSSANFETEINEQMLCTMEEVREAIKKDNVVLLDSRENIRYLGIEELIDKEAGHIPTAKNAFWKEGVSNNGAWLSTEEQEERFKMIERGKEVIVYCGSGVTACPNVLTLQSLRYENVRLYVGSWSDWISYPENQIEK